MAHRTSKVVIAGAGPVGMTAALVLGRAGVDVVVLEAEPDLSTTSRASTFHPPTLEILEELGVVDELQRLGIMARTYQYRDRTDGLVAEFDFELLADETRFPYRIQAEQSKYTRIALSQCASHSNVEVRFGKRVESVAVERDGAVVQTADGDEYGAEWLIAADGADSAVRKHLGLDFEGVTYPERYLVISTTEDIRRHLPDISYVNYISDPEEWLVLLRTPEHWRAMFPVAPEGDDEMLQAPDAVQARLESIATLGRPWPVLHTTLYRVHQRVASTFRRGPVLLAGDAAHINNPLGGLGMNSGIHDAYQYSTALVELLRGEADDTSVDAVAESRRRVSLDFVGALSERNWRNIRASDTAARARHHEELRAIAADDDAARRFLMDMSMMSPAAGLARA